MTIKVEAKLFLNHFGIVAVVQTSAKFMTFSRFSEHLKTAKFRTNGNNQNENNG